jgi:Mg-chelatase subunit ChlD
MRFSVPPGLLLLLLLPIIAWLGWPSRGYGRRREVVSLAVRLVIVLCLVFSLAGLETTRRADNLAVVFLLDVSDSMPEAAKSSALDYIRQALKVMAPDDQAALITFGGEALVERSMSSVKELGTITSIPTTNQTDLAEAIHLALALYLPDSARRMVILSDGAVTTGDAEEAARLAAASGVEIIVIPFLISPGPEVLISSVDAPAHLIQGERFDLNLTLEATQPAEVTVRVLSNGKLLYEGEHSVNRGTNILSLPLTSGGPGFTSYQVQISTANDQYYQNNELAAYTQITGPPKVLLVAPQAGEGMGYSGLLRPDEYTQLQRALEAAGFVVEYALPNELPSELPILAEYASVVLVDVPASQLNMHQMQSVQSYVRDLGGGLVVVGGPTSYGVGGYYRTPLEEALPLEMQIKDEQRRPTLSIVYIIDHSGSMSETSGGIAKVELAKEAAMRSIELLAPTDRVGVIAFDETASWVVNMTDMQDPQAVINAIGTIRSGGGTDILAGLQAMAQVLPDDLAKVKHVILLTDGGADPTGIPELVQRLYNDYGITLSTVGVGRDAAPFLPELAELGGGRYHFASDPASIPSIFTEETSLATRAYIIEEQFYPQLASSSPILSGINEVPPLYGYVGTSPKQASQVILVSHQGDPILAAWQYGLGKSVAFTSDATGRWAQDWVGWEGFPIFWSQAVRYTTSDRLSSLLEVNVEAGISNDESYTLVVNAQSNPSSSETGNARVFLNGYTMQANVVAPGGNVTTIDLKQVAPGLYEGDFTPQEQGVYLIHVAGEPSENNNATEPVAETAGWVLSYSPEFRHLESDPDALYRIAIANGGRLASNNPSEAFEHTLQAPQAARPTWPFLLVLATLLLPIDIAVRRLVVTRTDMLHGLEKLAAPLRHKAPATSSLPGSPQVSSLLQIKKRSRKSRDESYVPIKSDVGTILPPMPPPPVNSPSQAAPPTEPSQPITVQDASTTSLLLARKRSRQGKDSSSQEGKEHPNLS